MNSPSLEQVAAAFTRWRHDRSNPKCHTPKPLQQQAIALLTTHSEREIITALQIKTHAFRRWLSSHNTPAQTDSSHNPAFAVLPTAEPDRPAPPLLMDIDYPNGVRLHLQGEPSARLLSTLLQPLSLPGDTSL